MSGGRRGAAVRVVAIVVVAVVLATGTTGCRPRPTDRTRPVLLLPGWSLTGGTDCGATFDRTIGQLRDEGFTGPFVKVGFYDGDSNCTMNLRSWGAISNGSSWVELSKAFSAYVHETYTRNGIAVDVIGYSMGGNIARGAVQGTSAGDAGFAGPLLVQDVVAFGAPFDGAAWYSNLCLWGQCATLKPGADAIDWLDLDGDPQGVGGTEYTIFGSTGDAVTPVDSALEMDIADARRIRLSGVPHTGSDNYLGRVDIVTRAGQALASLGS